MKKTKIYVLKLKILPKYKKIFNSQHFLVTVSILNQNFWYVSCIIYNSKMLLKKKRKNY